MGNSQFEKMKRSVQIDDDRKVGKRRSSTPPKKRYTLPSRGYYSEILTDLNYTDPIRETYVGARKKTMLIWQVKTEKHAPLIRQLREPDRQTYLAPAERWMTFSEDRTIVRIEEDFFLIV